MESARYDGQTDWYESFADTEPFASARAFAVRLLGNGPGHCLDLGCGTGRAIPALAAAGWSVVGVDVSRDQLERAEQLIGDLAQLVHADAHVLPFPDEAFDAVISVLTHTDLDDVTRSFTEACRVLRPGGPFVYLGVHPCFGSPFVSRERAESLVGATAVLLPGYRTAGWRVLPADESSTKIRSRVGINHLPLSGLLNAIVESGFAIAEVREPGETDPPVFFAVRSIKRRTTGAW
jgi:SAM-dependent methyltransferase